MWRILKKNRLDELRRRYTNLISTARTLNQVGDKKLSRELIEEADIVAAVIVRLSARGV